MDTIIPVLGLITDHLDRQAKELPDQEFLVLDDTRLTYAETRQLVDRTAKALLAAGVAKGDRVAMMSAPRPEFFIHFLATTSIGAIWVGLNPKYTAGELAHIVGDAEPSMIFGFSEVVGEDQYDKLLGLLGNHDSVQRLILFDRESDMDEVDTWDDFIHDADQSSDEELAQRRSQIDPLDPAFLVYTSGSTGRPKGALLTHRGLNVCDVLAVELKALTGRRMICNLPINHIGAIGDICARTMTGGGTLFFQEKFHPLDMMKLIEAEKLNTIGGVPTMLQMCVSHPEFENIDLTSIDLLAWGGAAIPAELLETLIEKTGCTQCTMGYGMTETTGGITYSRLDDSIELLATTVGRPDARIPFRIWHAEDREALRGESGEVQVKGDFTMAGYWRLPEATAEAFTADGWFRTGDLAVHREDGYVQIVGRMSEMFKSGGYNVYPREVELALEEHAGVSMAAVISIPDPTFQEIGIAYVMSDGLSAVDPVELRSFVRQHLANYKVPKEIVVLDELPMLPIGKVDKKALKARHA